MRGDPRDLPSPASLYRDQKEPDDPQGLKGNLRRGWTGIGKNELTKLTLPINSGAERIRLAFLLFESFPPLSGGRREISGLGEWIEIEMAPADTE